MSNYRRVPVCILLILAGACGDSASGEEAGTTASTGAADSTAADPSGPTPTSEGSTGPASGTQGGTLGETSLDSSGGDPTTAGTPDMGGPPVRYGRCGDQPPEGATLAPEIPKYGGTCPVIETGYVEGQMGNILPQSVAGQNYDRSFLVIVPDDYEPGEQLPVMFMWHWLGGSGKDFYERAEAQDAVNEKRFIAVIPDGRDSDQGVLFKWPFSILDSDEQLEAEFQFFDDMLSCVHEQFGVDKDCVGSVGVSAGALFTDQLVGGRGDRLSSFLSLSGGTGGGTVRPFTPPAHKLPALVLWGGPDDFCVVINFEDTSRDLEKKLVEGGHFVEECIHNCNHSTPPFDVPEGMTAFAPLWDFLLDHPYWLGPGESPYNELGLPASIPSWCAVGVGNAVPPPGVCDKNECS